jgi:protein phosphatase PTC1
LSVVIYSVLGILAITRALGDADLKPHVTSKPYVVTHNLQPTDSMVIVACDGLWDVVGDQEACDLAWSILSSNEGDPERCTLAADALIDLAMKKNTTDNLSVIVCFMNMDGDIIVEKCEPVEENREDVLESQR